MEKCGNIWKNGRFSGRIWPDWGSTARADLAGLGSIGFYSIITKCRGNDFEMSTITHTHVYIVLNRIIHICSRAHCLRSYWYCPCGCYPSYAYFPVAYRDLCVLTTTCRDSPSGFSQFSMLSVVNTRQRRLVFL